MYLVQECNYSIKSANKKKVGSMPCCVYILLLKENIYIFYEITLFLFYSTATKKTISSS